RESTTPRPRVAPSSAPSISPKRQGFPTISARFGGRLPFAVPLGSSNFLPISHQSSLDTSTRSPNQAG
ncbi:hypothetical protein CSPX01_01714, partial [Colletotrichum filicis]